MITTNKNMLSPTGLKFVLKRSPNVEFYCQRANIPGVSTDSADINTPFNVIPFSPDKMTFSEFTLSFLVDEDLTNYLEVFNWMTGHSFPESFDQFKELATKPIMSDSGVFSDGSLILMNSAMNPNYEVTFLNMFPTSLSDISMDVTDASIEYAQCTVSFKYERFKFTKL
jgi:hypothetical protein